jgi:hypothetical protein
MILIINNINQANAMSKGTHPSTSQPINACKYTITRIIVSPSYQPLFQTFNIIRYYCRNIISINNKHESFYYGILVECPFRWHYILQNNYSTKVHLKFHTIRPYSSLQRFHIH